MRELCRGSHQENSTEILEFVFEIGACSESDHSYSLSAVSRIKITTQPIQLIASTYFLLTSAIFNEI